MQVIRREPFILTCDACKEPITSGVTTDPELGPIRHAACAYIPFGRADERDEIGDMPILRERVSREGIRRRRRKHLAPLVP